MIPRIRPIVKRLQLEAVQLSTTKTLGITVPISLLARADEVIE